MIIRGLLSVIFIEIWVPGVVPKESILEDFH